MKTDDYATKEEVRLIVREEVDFIAQKLIHTLVDYIDEKNQELKVELKGEINDVKQVIAHVKEDIIQFKDDILHEIIDLRDDITVTTGYRDMIENHEQRITDLEKKKTN